MIKLAVPNHIIPESTQLVQPSCVSSQLFLIKTLEEAKLLAQRLAKPCHKSNFVEVGLWELMANAIEHGNLGISFEDKTKLIDKNEWYLQVNERSNDPSNDQWVVVSCLEMPDHFSFTITDQGKGFDSDFITLLQKKSQTSTHGRGIIIAKELAFDHLYYLKGGRQVKCILSKRPILNYPIGLNHA